MKLLFVMFTTFATLLHQCEGDIQNPEIIEIEFGTSFGMCMGDCTQIVTFSEGTVSKKIIPRGANTQERTCSIEYSDFTALSSKVSLPEFYSLEETIGCPDCADGGAEWIAITTNSGTKKVIYEYGKAPDEVKSFYGELKKYYVLLGKCDQH